MDVVQARCRDARGGRSVARVGGLCDRSGLIAFLDHQVARPGVDDLLVLGELVAASDREPATVGADLLIFADGELYHLIAA
jgi:hypothetical protein